MRMSLKTSLWRLYKKGDIKMFNMFKPSVKDFAKLSETLKVLLSAQGGIEVALILSEASNSCVCYEGDNKWCVEGECFSFDDIFDLSMSILEYAQNGFVLNFFDTYLTQRVTIGLQELLTSNAEDITISLSKENTLLRGVDFHEIFLLGLEAKLEGLDVSGKSTKEDKPLHHIPLYRGVDKEGEFWMDKEETIRICRKIDGNTWKLSSVSPLRIGNRRVDFTSSEDEHIFVTLHYLNKVFSDFGFRCVLGSDIEWVFNEGGEVEYLLYSTREREKEEKKSRLPILDSLFTLYSRVSFSDISERLNAMMGEDIFTLVDFSKFKHTSTGKVYTCDEALKLISPKIDTKTLILFLREEERIQRLKEGK